MRSSWYWGGLCDDVWWLDYMEDEFQPQHVADIERLLKQSPGDRRRLARLQETRELIADCDLAHAPEDDRAAERLHDRIMAQIDGSNAETDPERGKETTPEVRIR